MLSRIYLNGNENTSYPLVPNDVYPDNLITGIKLVVSDMSYANNIYVSSVTVSPGEVSVLFSGDQSVIGSAVFNEYDKYPITTINDPEGRSIGWISFGSGIEYSGTYSGNVSIDITCIIPYPPEAAYKRKLTVDNKTIDMPDTINFITNDPVTYNGSRQSIELYNIPSSGSGYMNTDSISVEPITSVNGIQLGSERIIITLPLLYGTEFDTFIIRNPDNDGTTIEVGVNTNLSNYVDISSSESFSDSTDTPEYPLIADTFGCGYRQKSFLIDTILTSKDYNSKYELPLDKVIDWYNTVVIEDKRYTD